MADPGNKIDRREFLKQGALAAGGIAVTAITLTPLISRGLIETTSGEVLRPPGAIKEETFLYACIKCGLCVQICPVRAIKLADIDDGLGYGAVYIDARQQACDFSCDAMQCAETCPTAALDFKIFRRASTETSQRLQPLVEKGELDPGEAWQRAVLSMKEATHMGMAKLIEKTCLALKGKGFKGTPRGSNFKGVLRYKDVDPRKPQPVREQTFDREICDLCVIHCPIGEKALKMADKILPNGQTGKVPVIGKSCTGCGTCEMICPTEPSSIVVLSRKTYEEVHS